MRGGDARELAQQGPCKDEPPKKLSRSSLQKTFALNRRTSILSANLQAQVPTLVLSDPSDTTDLLHLRLTQDGSPAGIPNVKHVLRKSKGRWNTVAQCRFETWSLACSVWDLDCPISTEAFGYREAWGFPDHASVQLHFGGGAKCCCDGGRHKTCWRKTWKS